MKGKILGLLKKPQLIFNVLGNRGFFNWMKDETYLRILYRVKMNKRLNLEDPRTFNEKIQWLKLYDRNPEYTRMVDKYEAKRYVADLIGEEYVIPTLGVWNHFDDIDFQQLPDQFVLKCTHDSGGVVICRNKSTFDYAAAKRKIEKALRKNFYWSQREWPYKNVKPRVIAEKYMEDSSSHELQDYKLHNFRGVTEFILVCKDRFEDSGLTEDFFTKDWKHIDVKRPRHPNSEQPISKPKSLEKMLELSELLSSRIPFVRTDFYTVDDKVYFGELTFYPGSGLIPFIPSEWDARFGQLLELPDKTGSTQ